MDVNKYLIDPKLLLTRAKKLFLLLIKLMNTRSKSLAGLDDFTHLDPDQKIKQLYSILQNIENKNAEETLLSCAKDIHNIDYDRFKENIKLLTSKDTPEVEFRKLIQTFKVGESGVATMYSKLWEITVIFLTIHNI